MAKLKIKRAVSFVMATVNLLVLVGAIKASDRIVREMMGLGG